jgi:hypothetical protein
MPWTWQTIGNRKHLIVNGRVSCDAIGIPEPGDAIPCRDCVEILLAMEKAALPE